MPLYFINNNQKCMIEEAPQIPLLHSLGIRKGINVTIMTKHPFGGPVVLKIGNRNVAIDKAIAQQIKAKVVAA